MASEAKAEQSGAEAAFEGSDNRSSYFIDQHERLDRLRDDIFRLGLERNVVELELYGYTIIKNAMPLSLL